MSDNRRNNKGGNNKKGNVQKKKAQVKLTEKEFRKLNQELSKCMLHAFKFVTEVFTCKEKIEINFYTKEGLKLYKKVDKYAPELKARLFEKLADKMFADKKEILKSPEDPDKPNVIGFNFVKIKN